MQIETTDLRELAKFAGGNPKTFYRGARLEGVDISGQDLRGMEFTDLQAAKIKFDKRTKLDRRYIKAISPKKVQNELASGATPQSFRDEAWAEKWLLQWARLSRNADREPLFDEGEIIAIASDGSKLAKGMARDLVAREKRLVPPKAVTGARAQ